MTTELIIDRSDGTCFYRALIPVGPRTIIGTLFVEDGRLVVRSAVDYESDVGSIVTPDCPWIGDFNFRVRSIDEDHTVR